MDVEGIHIAPTSMLQSVQRTAAQHTASHEHDMTTWHDRGCDAMGYDGYVEICTYTTYTCMHIHTHANTHAHPHTLTHTHAHTHAHAHAHARTHTHAPSHAHTHTRTYIHSRTRMLSWLTSKSLCDASSVENELGAKQGMRACICTCTCTCTCTQTHIHMTS